MKQFILVLFLICFSNLSFATTYINEINFKTEEFIELYSNTAINLSSSLFYDDKGVDKANTLKKIKSSNSPFYLIVGEDFISSHNLSILNCSIYSSQKSGLGYYGLKDSGEDFTILINQSLNFSYENKENFKFLENQSLNYNHSNNSYYISNFSICNLNFPQFIINLSSQISPNQSLNLTNISNINVNNITQNLIQNISISNCNHTFNIILKQDFYTKKIDYKFEINPKIDNFSIEYYITDLQGEIVKNKLSTKNLNSKSYTPKDYSNIYVIYAKLFYNSCILEDSKQVFFYSKTIFEKENSSLIEQDKYELYPKYSYIYILNNKTLFEDKFIKYEIYRGDTQKRTIYFTLNSKSLNSFDIEKYSKTSGKLYFNFEQPNNNLTIYGLNVTKSFIFNQNLSTNIILNNKSLSKNYFQISTFNLSNSSLNINIDTNQLNSSLLCYINYLKTQVSNDYNLTIIYSSFNLSFQINNTILKSKKDTNEYFLKLVCKYKKPKLQSYTYSSKDFPYLLKDTTISTIAFLEQSNQLDIFSIKSDLDKEDLNSEIVINNSKIIKENTTLISVNDSKKEKSIYFFSSALVILVIIFLFKW